MHKMFASVLTLLTGFTTLFVHAANKPETAFGTLPRVDDAYQQQVARAADRLMETHNIHTAAVGVIKHGRVAWSATFGEQRKGVPADNTTRLGLASVTKLLTSETVLSLIDDNQWSLETPVSNYYQAPDLEGDPRYDAITTAQILRHTTGLPNWRFLHPTEGYFDASMPLIFYDTPGNTFGYSGEAFELLAKAVEAKLNTPFPELVQQHIFSRLASDAVQFAVQTDQLDKVARPYDKKGVYPGPYCRPGGNWCAEKDSWSAASGAFMSVEALSEFVAQSISATRYSDSLLHHRNQIVQPEAERYPDYWVNCEAVAPEQCPDKQGYGLGWRVLAYPDFRIYEHGGSDWTEKNIVYYYSGSRDGVVILLNGLNRNAKQMMDAWLDVIDPHSPFIGR